MSNLIFHMERNVGDIATNYTHARISNWIPFLPYKRRYFSFMYQLMPTCILLILKQYS